MRMENFTSAVNFEPVSAPPCNFQASDEVEQRSPVAGNLVRTLTGPQVSLGVGVGILLAVLANRIATPELVDSQARTDILGVIASGGLVTNGVYLLVGVKKKTVLLSFLMRLAAEGARPRRRVQARRCPSTLVFLIRDSCSFELHTLE